MVIPRLEANLFDMHRLLVVCTTDEDVPAWPVVPGYLVEHTTDREAVVSLCNSMNVEVVIAFASAFTPRLFQNLDVLRPTMGRVLIVPDDSLANVLRMVNDCPAHYYLLSGPNDPLTVNVVTAAVKAVIDRASRGSVNGPRSLSARSLNPQSLARRRQLAQLSEREREILLHLAKGARTVTISQALHLSTHTVRNHIKAMFRKLDVHSQAELVALARMRSF
jgi:DNA-binding NarL/FixJ family response regulator